MLLQIVCHSACHDSWCPVDLITWGLLLAAAVKVLGPVYMLLKLLCPTKQAIAQW
jgi:hypothetical protein